MNMKKSKFILGVIAAAAFVAMTGCEGLTLRNEYVPPETEGIYVGLGGENTFNVTAVSVNGTLDPSKVNASLAPSAWNAVTEFDTVKIEEGQYVEFTFTQPTQGGSAWNSWALAIYDDNNFGNFFRGDNWLNASADAGFTSGKWSAGGAAANGAWSNGFDYNTCASQLPTDAVVVVRVEFDGEDVTITETVDGDLAYTTSSANW